MLTKDDRRAIGGMLCTGFRGTGSDAPDFDVMASVHVGSVILFDRCARSGAARNIESPAQVAALVEAVHARLDAVVCIDQEGGRVARLRAERGFDEGVSARAFSQKGSAAQLEAARRQAAQLASLGIDLNCAPCLDVAVAPKGAAIGAMGRSYSADAGIVEACGRMVLEAHAAAGIATCIKHFPGHGSAVADSHDELPDVTATHQACELDVFARLYGEAPAVMVGHVRHAGLDPDWPASMSRKVIQGVLRGQLGFGGVVITDSLDMGAITSAYGLEEVVVRAVNAGADLLVHGFNPVRTTEHPAPRMAEAVARAVVDGRIAGGMDRVRASAARVRGLRRQRSDR